MTQTDKLLMAILAMQFLSFGWSIISHNLNKPKRRLHK